MSRPIRIEFSGALYHVTSRGDRREAIYEDDADRDHFLAVLGQVATDFNWISHAYCLGLSSGDGIPISPELPCSGGSGPTF